MDGFATNAQIKRKNIYPNVSPTTTSFSIFRNNNL